MLTSILQRPILYVIPYLLRRDMIRRKTWRDRMTSDAINRKVNRRRNPVTTYTQLANEFGAPVYPNHQGTGGSAPSSSFRTVVRERAGNLFA